MTLEELLRKQADNAGFQLAATLKGFPKSAVDVQPFSHLMSARQQVTHLCEAYVAMKTHAAGGEHQWGSFVADAETWPELLATMDQLRADGIASAFALGEPGLEIVDDYIVGHDYYHVGQLASLRMAADPDWKPYSIYPG